MARERTQFFKSENFARLCCRFFCNGVIANSILQVSCYDTALLFFLPNIHAHQSPLADMRLCLAPFLAIFGLFGAPASALHLQTAPYGTVIVYPQQNFTGEARQVKFTSRQCASLDADMFEVKSMKVPQYSACSAYATPNCLEPGQGVPYDRPRLLVNPRSIFCVIFPPPRPINRVRPSPVPRPRPRPGMSARPSPSPSP
ncbi:hypothetical protein VTO42DRAFT_4889 [Malbranchea cinnamomea]